MPRLLKKNTQKYMSKDFSSLDTVDTPFDDNQLKELESNETPTTTGKRGKYKEKIKKRIVQVGYNTWVEVPEETTNSQVKKKVMNLGVSKRLSDDAANIVRNINKYL